MEIKRLFDYLDSKVLSHADQPFLSAKENGSWRTYSFQETAVIANRFSAALLHLGIRKDDKIALCANNRPEWNFIDLGCQQIGAVLVPLYPTASVNDFRFIMQDAEVKLAFVSDESLFKKVSSIQADVPSLQNIYTINQVTNAVNWIDILPPAASLNMAEINSHKAEIDEQALATIIYTSGTTGNPKGVMLSHFNMVSNLKATDEMLPFGIVKRALSFLPLCHIFERITSFAYLKNGIHVFYAESMDTISDNLKEVKPSMFTTVPRLLEKVYEKITNTGNQLTGIKRKLFDWSLQLATRYELNKQQGFWYDTQLAIARKLVFSKWQEALGGEVCFIVTGAAPLQPRLGQIFSAAGIPIIEGYGLSEASPGLAINRFDEKDRRIGTVGIPLVNVEIKLAEDGEILAKGPNIMKGYYKRPDLTAEVIDSDGYLHTGDIAEWVDNKFLKITDRKKELFKTTGGKYVAPAPIENKLKESPYIEQVMLVGDNCKFVTALIVPSFVNLELWTKQNGVEPSSHEQIVNHEKIKMLITTEIGRFNKDLGHVEQVKKFQLLPKEWTIEDGELTPTLKVKRKVILTKYAPLVEGMYAGS